MPRHVVVDGSNIATEGRTQPSLKQLVEAVETFMAENPDDIITVVVDATFGHRIDPREVPEFDAAIENNELVCPPAGAIGRGDAFVLTIANKANASILSNDSFQEFHGEYPWLFDEGRLIGGKPVPNIGWVFVNRTPVRGPVSRRAIKEAKRNGKRKPAPVRASKEASQPMPVPKVPPPGPARLRAAGEPVPAAAAAPAKPTAAAPVSGQAAPPGQVPGRGEPINDLLPFLEFVERYPVGTLVEGQVEAFSSHGAYVRVAGARCYVPLRHLGDPPPRSAREVLKIGETRSFVVVSFNAARRGIDVAAPEFVPTGVEVHPPAVAAAAGEVPAAGEAAVGEAPGAAAPARRARKAAKKAAPPEPAAEPAAEPSLEPAGEAAGAAAEPAPPAKRRAAKKAPAAPPVETPAAEQPVEPAPAAKRRAAKKAPAGKPAEVEAAAAPTAEATPASAAKPAARKRAGKQPAEQAPAEQPPTPEPPAAKKPAAKKAAGKKAPTAERVPVEPEAPRAAKKAAPRKAAARKAVAGPSAAEAAGG